MADKGSSGNGGLQWLAMILRVLLVGGALWMISRPQTTLAYAGFNFESSQAWSFLIFCLGVAGLTMAFVQICRMLYPFRGHFHRDALKQWLSLSGDVLNMDIEMIRSLSKRESGHEYPGGADYDMAKEKEKTQDAKLLLDWFNVLKELGLDHPSVQDALKEFEQRRGVASGTISQSNPFSSFMALYDLPIEQLSGQLSLALEAGLDEPKRFRNLIVLMAGREGATDLLRVVRPLPKPAKNDEEQGESEDETNYREEALAQAQSRATITRIGQLRIDAFQISAGGQWKYFLRLAVLAVSFVCSFIVLFNSTQTGSSAAGAFVTRLSKLPIQIAYSIVVGAIAGYLAMFLRDLVAIVEDRRRRS